MSDTDVVHLKKYRSNTLIYFHKAFIKDSRFPFDEDDELIAVIDGEKLIIQKTDNKNKINDNKVEYPKNLKISFPNREG